jgi:hypothetical protein
MRYQVLKMLKTDPFQVVFGYLAAPRAFRMLKIKFQV